MINAKVKANVMYTVTNGGTEYQCKRLKRNVYSVDYLTPVTKQSTSWLVTVKNRTPVISGGRTKNLPVYVQNLLVNISEAE